MEMSNKRRGYISHNLMNGVKVSFFCMAASSALLFNFDKAISPYVVSTIAGSGTKGSLDDSRKEARFNWPTGVAVDAEGDIYIADFSNNRIRLISSDNKVITLAGSGRPDFADGKGGDAHLKGPDNIAIGNDGNIYVADADNFRVRKVTPDGMVTTVSGSGIRGYRDGSGKTARFAYPTGIAVDRSGNLYVADRGSHTIRKITPDGSVSTFAGNGFPGYVDGKGQMSHFREPISVAVDYNGNVYVADSGNNAIRRISQDGVVVTIAGGGRSGYKDGTGEDALFFWPTGIAVDNMGYVYICDSQNNRIRMMSQEGVVSTVAGISIPGFVDGLGYSAMFNFPTGIDVDKDGNIYVADSGNNRIRKINRKGILQARR